MKVFPSEHHITSATTSKVAFIKFDDERSVEVGQHLTSTVLIDQALVCVPYLQPTIPNEEAFLNSGGSISAGQRQLPPHVVNKIQDVGDGTTVLLTVDPTLEQLGVPSYPSLPGDTDLGKVEEIRRTIYVGNLPKGVDGKTVLDFFNNYMGEVMYIRFTGGPETLPCAYAYVEFSQQSSIPIALQNNGIEFDGRPLRIQHSRVAIIKPQQKTADQALEEVEEAIRMGKTGAERARSRSPRRRRSPSPKKRSPRRRSRSRERERRRSRDRKRSRSRSKDKVSRRSRSRDKDRKRSRSRDRDRDSKRRSKSRDRRRRSRSRDKKRPDRDRSRSKDRKREKERKRSRSKSRDRKKEKEVKKDVKKEKKDDDSEDEILLREKLLEKAAARKKVKDSSDSEWEEAKSEQKGSNGTSKEKSKIKNERKRRHSMLRLTSLRRLGTRFWSTRQLVYEGYDDPAKAISIKSVTLPSQLCENEVLVNWIAAPINPADLNQIQGVYPVKPKLPAIGGNEGVGRVEKVGSSIKSLNIGDHVIPSCSGLGTWRELGLHTIDDVFPIDNSIPVEFAATLQVNPPTAYRMLKDFVDLKAGDTVIQNGGNSAVGRQVIQICRVRGLKSVSVVRKRENFDALVDDLKKLGADEVITEDDLFSRKRKFSGVRLALNCVGGRSSLFLASLLDDGGCMVTYGGMSKQPVQCPTGPLIFKDIRLQGFWMSRWYGLEKNVEERKHMYKELGEWMKSGEIQHSEYERRDIGDFRAALDDASSKFDKKQLKSTLILLLI
ncbi:unnamed protein product [Caenorhabditis auriculariae]|uniref:Enoyl-[acyl-carrier-protein] reductase, mitochondrial n=1 Tax=Caenorhabditis auriculariae TaxID=2777116 RepID=A0A8S1HB21_9PELO|nr:unnamed protein product [Caenorhabditis auriculariae]